MDAESKGLEVLPSENWEWANRIGRDRLCIGAT